MVKEHLKNYPNMPKNSYSLTSICQLCINLQVPRKLEIVKKFRCVPFLSLQSRVIAIMGNAKKLLNIAIYWSRY